MIGVTALILLVLPLTIIVIMAIAFISLIFGFVAGGASYLITKNIEVSKGWIILITFFIAIGLISWIL